jgi:hypothetical protein
MLQFADPDSPLSLGLQTAPWQPKFKPVSFSKYNRYGNSIQFFMRYESAVNSTGGDDVALAKSFIISCTLYYHLRTMCGLRTSGWSLPGVMSD